MDRGWGSGLSHKSQRARLTVWEVAAQLPEDMRQDMMQAVREILLNAMEHGAAFNPEQVVEVTAVRTGRSMLFYLRDPGAGFRRESLTHAAIANPVDEPTAHIAQREAEGIWPGGYGLLLAAGTVDELIYNDRSFTPHLHLAQGSVALRCIITETNAT